MHTSRQYGSDIGSRLYAELSARRFRREKPECEDEGQGLFFCDQRQEISFPGIRTAFGYQSAGNQVPDQ